MTDQQHPTTPPPELREEWLAYAPNPLDRLGHVATQAAQWGADQELEALLTLLRVHHFDNLARDLLAARRPKPKSLAEQKQAILAEIDELLAQMNNDGALAVAEPIRRALERLQELEEGSD